MDDEDILRALRSGVGARRPVDLAENLFEMTGGPSQAAVVMYFKRAFPTIPLQIALEAGGWHRVSDGGLSDEQFDALLSPYLRPSA